MAKVITQDDLKMLRDAIHASEVTPRDTQYYWTDKGEQLTYTFTAEDMIMVMRAYNKLGGS